MMRTISILAGSGMIVLGVLLSMSPQGIDLERAQRLLVGFAIIAVGCLVIIATNSFRRN